MKQNDLLPNFTALDQDGKAFVSQEYIGKKAMVFFFYPADFTPTCTKEACTFRDNYEDFSHLDAEVFGISTNSEDSHQKFKKKYGLPYRLLVDKGGAISKAFGFSKRFGLIPRRITFVFNKEGRLIEQYEGLFEADSHVEKALSALQEAVN